MPVSQDRTEVEDGLAALRQWPADGSLEYHAMTVAIEADDRWTLGNLCTRWVGWADEKKRIELRVSAPVTAHYAQSLAKLGIRCLFIVDEMDIFLFLSAGQPALIERHLAERFFPALVRPMLACRQGRGGFIEDSLLERGERGRRPSATLRATILERDGRRCRICARDPEQFADMELEVHHIRPWAKGGTSHPTNLITLCRRCHKALKPHFNRRLFELVEQNDALTELQRLAHVSAAPAKGRRRVPNIRCAPESRPLE